MNRALRLGCLLAVIAVIAAVSYATSGVDGVVWFLIGGLVGTLMGWIGYPLALL